MTQREAFEAWWGQAPVELQPLQPRTREDTLSAWVWEAWQAAQAAQPARQVPTTNYVQPVPDHCDRITWRNRYYHLPLAAALPYGPRPTFGAIGSRDVDVAEAQRAWDKAMAAQPAQMQINCDDCVYHYKDADQKPCAMCIHGTGLYDNFEPRIPAAQEVK